MSYFSDLKMLCADARAACKHDAERLRPDYPFQRWRQTQIVGGDGKGNRVPDGCEAIPWRGTKRELLAHIEYCRTHGATHIGIQGGIDGGERFADFEDWSYEPYIAEWDVSVPLPEVQP